MADAKGFYADDGLRVRILEGGPGDPAIGHVLDGTAEFAISSFDEQRDVIEAGELALLTRQLRRVLP